MQKEIHFLFNITVRGLPIYLSRILANEIVHVLFIG